MTDDQQQGRTYNRVRYAYKCKECGTSSMNSVKELCTLAFYFPITIGNDTHSHDCNRGNAELICSNGHTTRQQYVAACECGWHS